MDGKQRKIQLETAFTTTTRGETPKTVGEGTEPFTAKSATERQATERLMEEVCERENANKALRKVRNNQGSPGIGGMTVDKLRDHLIEHWPAIREQLIAGKYKPSAVKRVTIQKPDGGERKLGIPTVYVSFCQTPSVFQDLESWIRRRLRSIVWRQWKRGTNRYAELRRRGIPHFPAAVAAGAPKGPWRMARHAILQRAFPNVYFDSLGLPRLVIRNA